MKMLGNSTHGLLPYQKHLPFTGYAFFQLLFTALYCGITRKYLYYTLSKYSTKCNNKLQYEF